MSKAPAFQFYPADYQRDTRVLTAAARGIWMDVLCLLHWTGPFVREKTMAPDAWARALSVQPDEFLSAVGEFETHNTCDVSRDCHGNVTLKSRRMLNDDKTRRDAAKRQAKKRENDAGSRDRHANVTDMSQRSSSSSSSSVTKVTLTPVVPTGDQSEGDEAHRILISEPALAGMSYEQDLQARRAAGYWIRDAALVDLAMQAAKDACIMGELDHPAMWWRRWLERNRSGSSTVVQKKEPAARRVQTDPAVEALKP